MNEPELRGTPLLASRSMDELRMRTSESLAPPLPPRGDAVPPAAPAAAPRWLRARGGSPRPLPDATAAANARAWRSRTRIAADSAACVPPPRTVASHAAAPNTAVQRIHARECLAALTPPRQRQHAAAARPHVGAAATGVTRHAHGSCRCRCRWRGARADRGNVAGPHRRRALHVRRVWHERHIAQRQPQHKVWRQLCVLVQHPLAMVPHLRKCGARSSAAQGNHSRASSLVLGASAPLFAAPMAFDIHPAALMVLEVDAEVQDQGCSHLVGREELVVRCVRQRPVTARAVDVPLSGAVGDQQSAAVATEDAFCECDLVGPAAACGKRVHRRKAAGGRDAEVGGGGEVRGPGREDCDCLGRDEWRGQALNALLFAFLREGEGGARPCMSASVQPRAENVSSYARLREGGG
eukprot:314634-Chlamydomonas_euryale.AAC.2